MKDDDLKAYLLAIEEIVTTALKTAHADPRVSTYLSNYDARDQTSTLVDSIITDLMGYLRAVDPDHHDTMLLWVKGTDLPFSGQGKGAGGYASHLASKTAGSVR